MMNDTPGLLAEFESADAVRAAVEAAVEAGYTRFDAFSPFPMPDLARHLGYRPVIVPAITPCWSAFPALTRAVKAT